MLRYYLVYLLEYPKERMVFEINRSMETEVHKLIAAIGYTAEAFLIERIGIQAAKHNAVVITVKTNVSKYVTRNTNALILRNGTPSRAIFDVGVSQAVISALRKNFAVFLIKLGSLANLLLFLGRERGRIELVAEGARHSDGKAAVEGGNMFGLVIRRSRNVGAYSRHRIYKRGAVLNTESFYRVGVIAGPNLRHIIKHTRVEASAAARAGLEQDVGEFLVKAFHYGIKTEIITEIDLALTVGRKKRASRFAHITVEIPLYVRDTAFTQNLRN